MANQRLQDAAEDAKKKLSTIIMFLISLKLELLVVKNKNKINL